MDLAHLDDPAHFHPSPHDVEDESHHHHHHHHHSHHSHHIDQVVDDVDDGVVDPTTGQTPPSGSLLIGETHPTDGLPSPALDPLGHQHHSQHHSHPHGHSHASIVDMDDDGQVVSGVVGSGVGGVGMGDGGHEDLEGPQGAYPIMGDMVPSGDHSSPGRQQVQSQHQQGQIQGQDGQQSQQDGQQGQGQHQQQGQSQGGQNQHQQQQGQQYVQLEQPDNGSGPSGDYRANGAMNGMPNEEATKKKSRASRALYMREYRKRKSLGKSPGGSPNNIKPDMHQLQQSTPSRLSNSFSSSSLSLSHQDPNSLELDEGSPGLSDQPSHKKQKMGGQNGTPSPSSTTGGPGGDGLGNNPTETPSPGRNPYSQLALSIQQVANKVPDLSDSFTDPLLTAGDPSGGQDGQQDPPYIPQYTTFHHPHHLDILPYPRPQFLFHLECYMETFRSIGNGPYGERYSVVFKGGQFEGPLMRGKIVPGGGDWELVEPNGTAHLDTRYVLETNDGASIYIQTKGTRTGPSHILKALGEDKSIRATDYLMRLQCTFETGDPKYQWLNKAVCVASAARCGNQVVYDCYQIL